MRQYTNESQTAKLMELGYFRPALSWKPPFGGRDEIIHEPFSIGELIEMLPESASLRLRYVATKRAWIVDVDVLGKQGRCHRGIYYAELIDALYAMILQLKEEGVI